MVNNISNTSYQQARPQNGLSEADVLIEIKVEGGITRFCALFTDYRDLPEICPVRSARDQFFQLILPRSRFMCISARAWCRRSMLRITLIRIWM